MRHFATSLAAIAALALNACSEPAYPGSEFEGRWVLTTDETVNADGYAALAALEIGPDGLFVNGGEEASSFVYFEEVENAGLRILLNDDPTADESEIWICTPSLPEGAGLRLACDNPDYPEDAFELSFAPAPQAAAYVGRWTISEAETEGGASVDEGDVMVFTWFSMATRNNDNVFVADSPEINPRTALPLDEFGDDSAETARWDPVLQDGAWRGPVTAFGEEVATMSMTLDGDDAAQLEILLTSSEGRASVTLTRDE